MSELIGLLPAAGRGLRLGTIPCSKEIMPLGFQYQELDPIHWQPVTAIEMHLRALKLAGAGRAAIVVSETKADVIRYLGNGDRYGISIAYLYQEHLRGMPHALDLARPWISSAITLFSMPDTLVTPTNTMARLVQHHRTTQADITLGLFPTTTPYKFGMVACDEEGQIINFVDKPDCTDLQLMWGLAVWSATFSRFMGTYLDGLHGNASETVLSDVLLAALRSGFKIDGIALDGAYYHDIGTPEDFQAVVVDLALKQGNARV